MFGEDRARLDGTTSMWGSIRRLLPIPLPAPFRSADHQPKEDPTGNEHVAGIEHVDDAEFVAPDAHAERDAEPDQAAQ